MALGNQIRKHRTARGLTLEQLSELSGVDVGTISALENRDSVRSKYARKIAQAFGMTVEYLDIDLTVIQGEFVRIEEKTEKQIKKDIETKNLLEIIEHAWKVLPDKDKAEIFADVLSRIQKLEAEIIAITNFSKIKNTQ